MSRMACSCVRTVPAYQRIVQDTINGQKTYRDAESRARTRSTYYYEEFTEESKSGFRFTHSVSEIQLGKHDTVVTANQIVPFRSHAHRLNACDQGNTR